MHIVEYAFNFHIVEYEKIFSEKKWKLLTWIKLKKNNMDMIIML